MRMIWICLAAIILSSTAYVCLVAVTINHAVFGERKHKEQLQFLSESDSNAKINQGAALSNSIIIGIGAALNLNGNNNLIIGTCAAASNKQLWDADLIGSHVSAPEGSHGFRNIDNRFCSWARDPATLVPCPPPEPPCGEELK